MVLLVETERKIADEQAILNLGNSGTTGLGDWATLATSTFTLAKQQLIFVKGAFVGSGTGVRWAGRITVDGVPVYSTGGLNYTGGWGGYPAISPDIYLLLAIGSHTVNFQGSIWAGTSPWMGSYSAYVGKLNFNDTETSIKPETGASTRVNATTVTLIAKDVVLAARKTPAGAIKNYAVLIHVNVKDSSAFPARRTHGQNNIATVDAGKHNLSLFLNDVQVAWSAIRNDDADGSASNPSYGCGSDLYYYAAVSAGQTLNLKVKDVTTTDLYATASVSVTVCPWITPAVDYEPVALDFAQGSTFYAGLEPLFDDSVKVGKLGKTRFLSFGDATDFYDVESGTGNLSQVYTFDVVCVGGCEWHVVSSTHVCISYLGVDTR